MIKPLKNNQAALTIYIDDVLPNELPQSLHEVVELIGLPALLKLVSAWPGVRIFVPKLAKIKDDHPIAEVIGLEAASKLAKYFDGEEFPIPKAEGALIMARNRQIRRKYGPHTTAELALIYDLTERQIYRIVAEVEQITTQTTLF